MVLLLVLLLIGQLAVFIKQTLQIITGNERMFLAIAIALDRAGNVALNGSWWETISSRAGRKWPRSERFINWLFQDRHHCDDATVSDLHKLRDAAVSKGFFR